MAKKRRKKKDGKTRDKTLKLQRQILKLVDNHPGKAFTQKQVMKKLGIRSATLKKLIPPILGKLAEEGKLKKLRGKHFTSTREQDVVTGVVDYVNPRFGYVLTPELEDDIWVRTENMQYALDGDEVKVMLYPQFRRGRKLEGRVVEILQRGRTEYVGRLEAARQYAFVIPDSRKMHQDIFVRPEHLNKAKDNDKVIVEIEEWPGFDKNPIGKVIDVLGPAGDNDAEIHSIMAEFGLPYKFNSNVIAASKKISGRITQKEISQRRDFRDVTTFTIDPEDAKDFDDALSLQILDNGNFEVGVHIADVTHYVKPDTILDTEAYRRATSVYLVDRTIPMLPERLSNDLCSLKPKEDKLTFSAVFELDVNGHLHSEWFGRTIIHSKKRFTYDGAQKIIERVSGQFAKELTILNELALKLRAERFMRGAVNFETSEVKFKLDPKGIPLGIIPKVRKDAHKLIEEFMLLANKRVAAFVFGKKQTFVYRTHDYPDPEKIKGFASFARKFGYKLDTDQHALSSSLNMLLEEIEGKPEQNILQTLAIRSMAKAKYTTEGKGHFGLAFQHYTHFTSPIRRYPDVMVHRLLQRYLDSGKGVSANVYEKNCKHSSEMEVLATDAERASIKYKQVEYIESVKDQEFEGIVSGVTEYGVFVEMVENKCEGMVRLNSMTDDYYDFDEDNYRVIGRRKKETITLGDRVKVRVTDTDIDRRTIDLEFV